MRLEDRKVKIDKYLSGEEARAALNLNKTPTGYYEIPESRLPGLTDPQPVAGGTGLECFVTCPVDITGLRWVPFND